MSNNEARRPVVLLVDDDEEVRLELMAAVKILNPPFDIEFASSAEEGCKKLSERCYDAMVADVNLLGVTGVQVASEAHEKCPTMPKVFWTGYLGATTQEHAVEFKMPEPWPKPLIVPDLFANIEKLLASRTRECEDARHHLSVHTTIANIAAAALAAAASGGRIN
jgi:two-component system, NtrC family, nitrogen regulation response regulator GlnG